MNPGYYATKAARRLFADPTIWWRVLVLSAVQLIPVVGAFLVGGYEMIIMREAAWGIDRPLPRFSERREILRRGVDGFIVALVWTLPLTIAFIVGAVIWSISGLIAAGSPPEPSQWFVLPLLVPLAALTIFINVAMVRTAVYARASAGLSIRGVRQLIAMNKDRFIYVAWLPVAVLLVGYALTLPGTMILRNLELPQLLMLCVSNGLSFLTGLIQVPLSLVMMTAYGLWAGETNPSTWPPVNADSAVNVGVEPEQAVIAPSAS